MKIGVLAAQGAFAEHLQVLHKLNVETIPVRLRSEIAGIDALIIPGGESTTISRLLNAYNLADEIRSRALSGMPIFGTCAGMIMLANLIIDGDSIVPLRLIDIDVKRNAFGRQVDSFETELSIKGIEGQPFHGIFIRAPLIERVGPEVDVMARLDDGTIVAARQDKILVTSFHPELTEDLRFHRYFIDLMNKA